MLRIILLLFFLSFPLQGCYSQNQENMASQDDTAKKSEMPDAYTWDFGQVQQGEVLKHNFVLENDSDKTLTIKNINTSCGCTASKAQKSELSAGESTSIEVQFKTKGYSGPTQQYVYVHTDSLEKPIIRFTIKADVVKE